MLSLQDASSGVLCRVLTVSEERDVRACAVRRVWPSRRRRQDEVVQRTAHACSLPGGTKTQRSATVSFSQVYPPSSSLSSALMDYRLVADDPNSDTSEEDDDCLDDLVFDGDDSGGWHMFLTSDCHVYDGK